MRFQRAILLTLFFILCVWGTPIYADTDGSELQIFEPSTLEIQLGPGWSGSEFQLKTDWGLYPDVVQVDEDGILRLEIGGSNSYVLSYLNNKGINLPFADDGQQDNYFPESATNNNDSPYSYSIGSIVLISSTGFFMGLGVAFAISCKKGRNHPN